METAYFNRFSIEIPTDAVNDCSHIGRCDDDVEFWSYKIVRTQDITREALRDELSEYGAWSDDQLADDDDNWERIIWIAAGNIQEGRKEDNGNQTNVSCRRQA